MEGVRVWCDPILKSPTNLPKTEMSFVAPIYFGGTYIGYDLKTSSFIKILQEHFNGIIGRIEKRLSSSTFKRSA